ncbi:hypothetical protein CTI12_AA446360 [Artemisia annua]|uniref:Uncharacterized protein n=1 Tax=Artemisia annua TaxID=35608 RepID=A0A2U1LWC0_ARTAN|nr:hypothetical protein CTI12_AA446360 [Artemisia annua]
MALWLVSCCIDRIVAVRMEVPQLVDRVCSAFCELAKLFVWFNVAANEFVVPD